MMQIERNIYFCLLLSFLLLSHSALIVSLIPISLSFLKGPAFWSPFPKATSAYARRSMQTLTRALIKTQYMIGTNFWKIFRFLKLFYIDFLRIYTKITLLNYWFF